MKTLKEINKEARKYSEQEPLIDAFVAGARFALTGRYYKPSELFEQPGEQQVNFIDWWNLYNYKKGKKKTAEKWYKLSPQDREDCMKATPAYVENTVINTLALPGDKRPYRAHPLTYLNGRLWEDEIYSVQNNGTQQSMQLAVKAASILSDAY